MSSKQPELRALERQELLQRREATRRAIHRNAAQARGEFERRQYDGLVKITGLMLRGKTLKTMADPQVPLVYWRGRAFEELDDRESALACYRVLASWDGGSHPVVDDAREYIDMALQRLIELHGEPPGSLPTTTPQRDTRVFPRPLLTPGRLIGAVGCTLIGTLCAGLILAIVAMI